MKRRELSTATETRAAAIGVGMRRAFAGAAALAVVAVVLSCSGPSIGGFCTRDAPESCDPGDVRRTCDGREPCGEGRTCIESTRSNGVTYAACAIGGKAGFDERCDRDDDSAHCEGETWFACHGRYHEKEVDCRSLGLVCEEITRPRIGAFGNHTTAKCVESHVRDEGCAARTTEGTLGSRCDGTARVMCFGAFVLERIDCAAEGKRCVEVPDDLSRTPFVRCEG